MYEHRHTCPVYIDIYIYRSLRSLNISVNRMSLHMLFPTGAARGEVERETKRGEEREREKERDKWGERMRRVEKGE